MNQNEALQNVKNSAAAGRGLWIGCFISPFGELKDTPIATFLPEDAHTTLLHFGKKSRKPEDVQQIFEVMQYLSPQFGDLKGSLTGVGWFWFKHRAHIVGLVDSAALCNLRAALHEHMASQALIPSDRYGYIPHVTLRQDRGVDDVHSLLGNVRGGLPLHLPQVSLVCGDHHVSLGTAL